MATACDVDIPISFLRESFDHPAPGGRIYWKNRPAAHFPRLGVCHAWNARWAGKEAFTSDNGKGYRTTTFTLAGREWRLQRHRVIFALTHGRWPENLVDHKDGYPGNDSPENLRDATDSENNKNSRINRRNTSGTTGVYWFEPRQLWTARICDGKKQISLGYFRKKEDAIMARQAAEPKYGFSERHGSVS